MTPDRKRDEPGGVAELRTKFEVDRAVAAASDRKARTMAAADRAMDKYAAVLHELAK